MCLLGRGREKLKIMDAEDELWLGAVKLPIMCMVARGSH